MQKAYFLRRVGFLYLLFALFTIEQMCYNNYITKVVGGHVYRD